MTIQGAMNELINMLKAEDIPIYYKGVIEKVIETIDDYIDGKDDYIKRKMEEVEVVRCRDCKHKYLDGSVWNCPFGFMGGENFFCSYGAKDGDSYEIY